MGRLALTIRSVRHRPCLRPAVLIIRMIILGLLSTRQLCEYRLLGSQGESEQTLGRLATAMPPLSRSPVLPPLIAMLG